MKNCLSKFQGLCHTIVPKVQVLVYSFLRDSLEGPAHPDYLFRHQPVWLVELAAIAIVIIPAVIITAATVVILAVAVVVASAGVGIVVISVSVVCVAVAVILV